MKTSVGFFDSLFGKRTTLDLPMPDGTIKKIQVTEKWVREMERTGKLKRKSATGIVVVHTLGRLPEFSDPADLDDFLMNPRSTYARETWEIGTDITGEEAARYSDSGELFIFFRVIEGGMRRQFVSREKFSQLKAIEDQHL